MTPVPARRLLLPAAALTAASLGLVAAPELWPALLAADATLALVAVLDLLVSPRASAVSATRFAPERMQVLRSQSVVVRVENRSRARLTVRVRDGAPAAFAGADAELAGTVAPGGELRLEYEVRPPARGRFVWGDISVRFRTLLGLWERRLEAPAAGEARVYPSLDQLERYQLLARTDKLSALGIRVVRQRGGLTEFESLKEYVRGDDARQLDWKATARRGRLIVRNREAERNQTVVLLLDCGRLMNADEGGTSKLDHAVNAALLLSHVALSRGDRVGLCTFSAKVHSWVSPRGNTAQTRLISEALYDLRGDYSESDHGRALKTVAARHPKRSLLVVVTDFVDATTSAEMVAHLRLAAKRHVVVFAALKDVFLERAAALSPATEREAFRKAAALELLRERREVLERVRAAGGFVIDAAPSELTPPLLNQYLRVMLGGLL